MVMQNFGGKQVALRAPGEDFQVGSGGGGGGGGGEGVIRTRKRNHTSGKILNLSLPKWLQKHLKLPIAI